MKKNYIKPVFIAEAYNFNESFAKRCDVQVDPNKPLDIYLNSFICYDANKGETDSDSGHIAGNGSIPTSAFNNNGIDPQTGQAGKYLTLFNDGDKSGCMYDWLGPGKSVIGPKPEYHDYGIFQYAFAGNQADNKNHRPAYNGAEMYS